MRGAIAQSKLHLHHAGCRSRIGLNLSYFSSFAFRGGEKQQIAQLEELLTELDQRAGRADSTTYACLLQACAKMKALPEGKRVHAHIVANRLEHHRYLVSNLIVMYGKCGALDEAQKLLERMHQGNVFSWTAMIRAHVQNGQYEKALQLFEQMLCDNVKPNFSTFIALANACASLENLQAGRMVHSHIAYSDLEADVVLGNSLISMFSKCGSLEDAKTAFDRMPRRDVVSWNAMIAAYLQHDYKQEALELFRRMPKEGIQPSSITYITVLDACIGLVSLGEVKLIHADIVRNGLECNVIVGTALLDMYGKCGSLEDARKVFDKMNERNVISWTAMIAACSQNGRGDEALHLFQMMHQEGVTPNVITFVSVLNACTGLTVGAVEGVRAQITESGLVLDDILGTALLSMYGRCNNLEKAKMMFDKLRKSDVVSWNAMIAAFLQHSCCREAFLLFQQMLLAGMKPTGLSFITILNACGDPTGLAEGKAIHSYATELGLDAEISVGNAFLSMYGKCGSLGDARKVFDRMHQRDVISWNAMIGAYAQRGYGKEALELFYRMEAEKVKPNSITFVTILDANTSLTTLAEGKQLHARVIEHELESDPVVQNALLNMYAKCGNLEYAKMIFDRSHDQGVVSWTALIAAHAQHGHAMEALKLFRKMQQDGVRPNHITFISALAACNHAGLLEQGCDMFVSMRDDHGIPPTSKHFGCIVDLLGRSGRLIEAENLIKRMASQADLVAWMALLGACKNNNDVDRGQRCAERIIELDPQCSAAYIVLANLYAAAGRWADATNIRNAMLEKGVKKDPGCSAIEVNNELHEFVTGGKSHPRADEIYLELQRLHRDIKEAGYIPDTDLVVHNVSQDEKEQLLLRHSEKLAIAFGLISTPSGSPLHIIKNLRVCSDCHTATKFISKSVGREIVMRDSSRFHRFINGVCTCGDYCGENKYIGSSKCKKAFALIADHHSLRNTGTLNLRALSSGTEFFLNDQETVTFAHMTTCTYSKELTRVSAHGANTFSIAICTWSSWNSHLPQAIGCNLSKEIPCISTQWPFLLACGNAKALAEGKRVHAQLINNGLEQDPHVGKHLVLMYLKCGCLEEAHRLFDRIPHRNVVLWTAIIGAYINSGDTRYALQLFKEMQLERVNPDGITLVTILNLCSSQALLAEGKRIHAFAVKNGLESDPIVGNAIIHMYGKCGSTEDARTMFEKMPKRNIVTWTTMIAAYAQNGYHEDALEVFQQMQVEHVMPNRVTYLTLLDSCTSPAALEDGRMIHKALARDGFESEVTVGTSLVKMYGKCRSVNDARKVFDRTKERNVIAWTTMIASYVENGHSIDAFEVFSQMLMEGTRPNKVTFVTILDTCSTRLQAKLIHSCICECNLVSDTVVGNAMVNMYGKCGSLADARKIFDRIAERDVVSWTTLIAAYAEHGHCREAIQLYRQMQLKGVLPNKVTFVSVLSACANPASLRDGKMIHGLTCYTGMDTDTIVANAIVSMYAKCGSIEVAERMFSRMTQRNVVSWTSMITAYAEHGQFRQALELFKQLQDESVRPNKVTFIAVLDACASLGALEDGKKIHACVIESGCESNVVVATSLMRMYGKCGRLEEAEKVFDSLLRYNVVSWTAMITASYENGRHKKALRLFRLMLLEGIKPDDVSFISVLNACGSLAALAEGKLIHAYITESGFEANMVVGTALFNMYSKCGSVEHAGKMFNRMHQRDIALWNAMIAAYAQHGLGEKAVQLLRQMQQRGMKPNSVTFISILSACSRGGLVDEGCEYFVSMVSEHNITPLMEHYGCMIDLLGRRGYLDEAENFINNMPCQANAQIWVTLLGACRIHGDVERGIRAAEKVLELDVENSATYVAVSNIWGSWPEQEEVLEAGAQVTKKAVLERLRRLLKEAGPW